MNTKRRFELTLLAAAILFALGLATMACAPADDLHRPLDVDRLADGSTLVTDGGMEGGGDYSKIICIGPDTEFLWVYDEGLQFAHNADLQDNGNMIISDTGNDRVIEVDSSFNIVWTTDEITFSDGSHLDYPNDANIIDDDHVLITDRDNHRAFETDRDGNIVWQFGVTGVLGSDDTHLDGPHNADRLPDGNTIIADSNNRRIIEITPTGEIAWSYEGGLNWPRDADRLDNGNTLITDSRNQRIIEVTSAGQIVWSYSVGSGRTYPYDADRLESGNTLMGDLMNGRVMEVNTEDEIIWEYAWGLAYELDLEATYDAGTLDLVFDVGNPEPATWANYLILVTPSVSVVPLWTVSLETTDPPEPFSVSLPLSSLGWIGVYTGLFTAEGVQASDYAIVNTG